MELDPHTIQHILHRIQQQMRCPQCGRRMPIEFASVQLADEDFVLMQLRCDSCDAYIVLNATLKSAGPVALPEQPGVTNASSKLNLKEEELAQLRGALQESGGSFEAMFKKYGGGVEG